MKLFDSGKYKGFFVSSDVNKTLNALTDLAKYYKGGEKITKPIEGFQSEFINFLNYHNFVVQSVNPQYKE